MAEWTKRDFDKLKHPDQDWAWDDIRVPMQNSRINPSKSYPAFLEWIDGIFAYHFDPANDADWSLHFSAQIPHDWAEGTTLHPHLHWAPDSTNTGDVVWELDYLIANVGDTFASTATTLSVTQAASGIDNDHQIAEFGIIDAKDITISAMMHFRMTRLGDDAADTFTGNAIAQEFDIHYRRSDNGSYHEYHKLRPEYRDKKGKAKEPFLTGAW